MGEVVYRASFPPGEVPSEDSKGAKHVPRVNIITICGGMSIQKQKRLLSAHFGVDIIVATPGRLWDLLQEDEELGKLIKGIKFLVLDEADRMIENGHFAELESIIALTRRATGTNAKARTDTSAEFEGFVDDFANAPDSLEAWPVREDIRTYVFSATMSKELQTNVKKKGKRRAFTVEEKGRMGALGGCPPPSS